MTKYSIATMCSPDWIEWNKNYSLNEAIEKANEYSMNKLEIIGIFKEGAFSLENYPTPLMLSANGQIFKPNTD